MTRVLFIGVKADSSTNSSTCFFSFVFKYVIWKFSLNGNSIANSLTNSSTNSLKGKSEVILCYIYLIIISIYVKIRYRGWVDISIVLSPTLLVRKRVYLFIYIYIFFLQYISFRLSSFFFSLTLTLLSLLNQSM